jgi:transcriptional regulator with XRE-family HTH domain
LGELIRSQREKQGISMKELADRIGFSSPEAISMVETGRRRLALNLIPRLAEILNLDTADLSRRALKDFAPALYAALFGMEIKSREEVGSLESTISISSGTIELARQIEALSSRPRRLVIELVTLLSRYRHGDE